MHWGHWASDDLVKWDWQGVALAPDTSADEGGCFTGTAQMDGEEMLVAYAGLEADGEGGHYQQQCMAVSRDGAHLRLSSGVPGGRSSTLLPPVIRGGRGSAFSAFAGGHLSGTVVQNKNEI